MKGGSLKFLFLLFGVCSCYTSYKDYKVYDVIPTSDQYPAFSQWQYEEGIDFWRPAGPEKTSTVMVAPKFQLNFENYLSTSNLTYTMIIDDVEVILEKERESMTQNRQFKPTALPGMVPDFSIYWSSTEMETYCTFLASTFPQFVQMETLGFSPGNRRIYAMKVSSGVFGQKPIIAMETGMHAREWASPPTTLYLLHRLIETADSRNELLARVDWLIIPMDNPDGYEHSRAVDRMWRQNRRQVTPTCVGVDINRNFGYSWRAATLLQPCGSQTYPGLSPISEPETFAIHNIVTRYASNIKLYLSVHTFGDMVLWPWGYAGSPGWINTWPEHDALGFMWRNDILAQGGRNYIVGNVADVLGNAFGACDDHMAGHFSIPYVYTLELTSGFQFTYPEARIQALAFETFWGYRAMALHIGSKFG